MPLAGFGNTETRMSQQVLHPLRAHCIALSDEDDNTELIFTLDLIAVIPKLCSAVRAEVLARTGISGEHVILSGTHTHSAPDLTNWEIPSLPRYFDQIVKSMEQAAKDAVDDRRAAQMYTGRIEFENMNFIRHFVFEDGTKTGYPAVAATAGKPFDHVYEPDKVMQLVKFVREGGKDVLLVNWQGHPQFTSAPSRFDASSDAAGVFRDKLSAALNCHVAYYTGASGNTNLLSLKLRERIYKRCGFLQRCAGQGRAGGRGYLYSRPYRKGSQCRLHL